MLKILLKNGVKIASNRSSLGVQNLSKKIFVKVPSSDECFCLICSTWKKKEKKEINKETWVNDYPVI